MTEGEDRRPIASRDTGWARDIAHRLVASNITPNQISIASIGAAAIAGLAFWQAGSATGTGRLALLGLGALACQMRLLCNLFDGMVAMEGGKQAADGPFWNEFPDRIADILILAGVGYGLGAPELGWAAAALAMLTAYVRELGRAIGAPSNFCGPMAKPHRMALITLAAVFAMAEMTWGGTSWAMGWALWVVAIGAAITTARRAARIVKFLKTEEER